MLNPADFKVAYFSMEVGLTSKIPTYTGGLGVLAGDMLKAAADSKFPMAGVTLLTKKGYFFQDIQDDKQVEEPVAWSINDFLKPVDVKVTVSVLGEEVSVGCWLCEIFGTDGYLVPLYLLHTDFPENSDRACAISDTLYGDGSEYRLMQEVVLGVGGLRLLNKLGYTNVNHYHMNEGHSAFLALELDRVIKNTEDVKKLCVFTTHTPVPAGHDRFDIELVKKVLDETLFNSLPKEFIEQGELNMTSLALDFSDYINGVAKKHAEVSKTMFPNYPIHSITNGVHAQSWASKHFTRLYDYFIPTWRQNPTNLMEIVDVPNQKIWEAHFECKKQIIDFANSYSNAGLDYDYFTIGWARRFTSYKRPDFLLNDLSRLMAIAEKIGPIQIVYAGKAHPKDTDGKELIEKVIKLSKELHGKVKMVYLQNYDIYLAKFITSGVDVWLNTPIPPHEASGTSGMKCALNGVPQISVLDGWWQEGCVEGETGWSFDSNEDLYNTLENKVLPIFYNEHEAWRNTMKKTIQKNASYFNSFRMLNDYREQAYKL